MSTIRQSPELNFDEYPPEVVEYQMAVREFARTEVAPRALELDQEAHDHFAWDLVQKGHELGLTRALLPPEFGGLGAGVVGVCVGMEELAAACPGVALIFGATMLGQAPVLLSGDPELQARFLPLFSSEQAVLACNAVCEEHHGVDLVVPGNVRHAHNITTMRRDGDEYVINGHKRVITNAAVANFASVFVKMDGLDPDAGLTCVMVPLDSPGVTRGPVADKMGYRACLGSELFFEDVRVPAANLIGGEGEGLDILRAQGNMARSSVAAVSVGVARHALEIAVDFCGTRIQGGLALREHQMTARKLAEMTSKVDAARLLYLAAANKVDNRLPAPEYEPAVAKFFADRVATEVASEAVSLLGSRGYIREFGLEKVLRDSYGARIYEGTAEALALAITDCLYSTDDEEGWDDDDDL
jgi:alkylation response protein AidB-like acyl-CoA dehydrogenase